MAVFDAVICKHFSVHVKKHCFLILHGMMLTHALWNETFLYSEMPSSFLVNTVQTLSKSVYNCQSYWQKFRGTFLWPTVLYSDAYCGKAIGPIYGVCVVYVLPRFWHKFYVHVSLIYWLNKGRSHIWCTTCIRRHCVGDRTHATSIRPAPMIYCCRID